MSVSFQSPQGDSTLLSLIKGFRLQPLKDLRTGETVAWELLSWLDNQDAEIWFSSLSAESHLAIFCWQATEVLKSNGKFWLNLPVKVLCNPQFIACVTMIRHQNRLTIEIQDPETIMLLDPLEKLQLQTGVRQLRKTGWPVWLDDVTSDIAQELLVINLAVDGIKLDRSALATSHGLSSLVQQVKNFTDFILAEGIESDKLLERVTKEDISFGQGFLWPEKKLPVSVPGSYVTLATNWLDNKKQFKKKQVSVFINTSDSYIRQGILYLLWDLIKPGVLNGNPPFIVLCDRPVRANVIINEHIPGDLPFKCVPVSSLKANMMRRSQYVIYLYKDHVHKPKMRCPGIGVSLCYDDKLSTYRYAIKHSLERISLSGNDERTTASFPVCRLCEKRQLTMREKDIVYMMAKGRTAQSIAAQYGCTSKVVGAHKRALMRKLHINNNMEFYRFLKRIANGVTSV